MRGRAFPHWLPEGLLSCSICFGTCVSDFAVCWFVSELLVGSNVLSIAECNKLSKDECCKLFQNTVFFHESLLWNIQLLC